MTVDPVFLVITAYLLVMAGADRIVDRARRLLTDDQKVRLGDAAASNRSATFLPSVAAVLLLGVGLAVYPSEITIVVSVVYAVYLGLISFSSILLWRRLQTLILPGSYLRAWLVSRTIRILTVTSLCVYIVAYSGW